MVNAAKVLELGDPGLRKVCAPVTDLNNPIFLQEKELLIATLEDFRTRTGFGRAIAAPQIGISKRFIALNLEKGPFVIINPETTHKSEETFTMWDDCMSFPWLIVKVRRHSSVSLKYLDDMGKEKHWENLEQATAELLQHEIDHLNGVLAVDLALDSNSLIGRNVFEEQRELFIKQVDFVS